MALNDVKEITIPEGSVKQIQDSNGNIIWGSQSAFPYRRLEYIQGDGKNYVVTNANVTLTSGTEYWFQIAFDQTNPTNALSGAEKSNAYSTNDRFKFGTSGTGYLYCGYANGFGANTTPVKDRFYEFHAMQGSQYIKDLTTNTILGTASYSLTGTNHGGSHIALFGVTQGSDTNLLQVANNNRTRIKLFRLKWNNQNWYFIPVQRKSDGKLGYYNTYRNEFWPEAGTGALIAGPVVDEYWNLQA